MRPLGTVLLIGAAALGCAGGGDAVPEPEVVYSESPPVWFEAHRVLARIAPNARLAALPLRWPLSVRVIDLQRGAEVPDVSIGLVDSARSAAFMPNGEPVMQGWRGSVFAWYTRGRDSVTRLAIPPNAVPRWSADGRQVAYFVPYARVGEPEHGLHVRAIDGPRWFPLDGRVTGVAWLPGDGALLVMTADSLGGSTLSELQLASGKAIVRVRDLDADPSVSPIAVSPDGQRAFIALSTANAPQPLERHRPNADRDLDIYEIDLVSGAKQAIVATPAEEAAPAVANGHLYWTHTAIDIAIVTLVIAGGEPQILVPGGFLPSWRPDGRAVGFAYGGFLAADWVLNWDGGMVQVHSAASATSSLEPVIRGFHEDFQPVWSPNGNWIGYHSHRSAKPVPLYATAGTTDDIYLRRAGTSDEIRLTDYGWEVGSPDWSRDGRRLLFTGWLRPDKGEGRGTYAAIVTIDPTTGRALNHRRIPLGPIPSAEMASWSPVSDDIAIEAVEKPGTRALWLVQVNGSRPRKVVEYAGHTYGGVDWTPDGSALVYSAIVDGHPQLFTVAVAGGSPRQLTRGSASILHPQVSPDGRHIAATRIVQTKEIRRMPLR